MEQGKIDLLMQDLIDLEKVKLKLVKDQDFTHAAIVRMAQNNIRKIIRYLQIIDDKELPPPPTT